jgi:acylphosphatase
VSDDGVDGRGRVARRVVAHGRVQGVYFRASTRHTAERHGVTGWVRNRADGAVEAWLEGPQHAVEAVEAWIVTGGPPAAEVARTETAEEQPEGLTRFEVQ